MWLCPILARNTFSKGSNSDSGGIAVHFFPTEHAYLEETFLPHLS